MTEIIIAIILHLSTVLGGLPSDKEKAERTDKEEKPKGKTEQPLNGSGGSGGWQDG